MGERIAAVYLCTNGMMMVFDERGEQIPAYQGRISRCLGPLLAALPRDPVMPPDFCWSEFGQWAQPVSRAQVECFYRLSFAPEQER